MVAVLEKITVNLDDVDEYMRALMRDTPPATYREAALKAVDWLIGTGRFAEIAPTLAVTALMQRARKHAHDTHRGLTNWPSKKIEATARGADPVAEEDEEQPAVHQVTPLEMIIAADLGRPMVGRWHDMEFMVSKRRMRLAEMTRFDCLEKAVFYGKAAQSSTTHQQFLAAVGNRLEGGQTVGEVFADGDLARLWETTEKAVKRSK